MKISLNEKAKLASIFKKNFDNLELRIIYQALDLDFGDLSNWDQGKLIFVLLDNCINRNKLEQLFFYAKDMRPSINFDDFLITTSSTFKNNKDSDILAPSEKDFIDIIEPYDFSITTSNIFKNNKDGDILLLAPSEKDLMDIIKLLTSCEPNIKNRIYAEYDCVKALQLIKSPSFKLKIVYSKGSDCLCSNIHELCLQKTIGILIVIKEKFPKLINFSPSRKEIQVEQTYFENKISNVFFNTLLNAEPVYISYGSEKETDGFLKKISFKFKEIFPHINISYDRSKENGVGYKNSLKKYIDELVKGKNIILIINDKYLKSKYCMKEYIDILDIVKEERKNTNQVEFLRERIYPVVMKSAYCIYEPIEMIRIKAYWQEKRKELVEILEEHADEELEEELILLDKIIKELPKFTKTISDFYNISAETLEEANFFDLFWTINEQLVESGYMSLYNNENEMKKALGLKTEEDEY